MSISTRLDGNNGLRRRASLLTSIAYLGAKDTPRALVELEERRSCSRTHRQKMVAALPAFEAGRVDGQGDAGARFVPVPSGPDFRFPLQGVLDTLTPHTRSYA